MVLTRRAYRESMQISRWLPNEVLVHIIQHSRKADQASLSRVSRLFHDLCIPVLYRVVKIEHSDALASFCSAVIGNPSQADFVRSFTVDVVHDYTEPPHGHADVLLASLKLMLRLNHLVFSGTALDHDLHRSILLEECSFPQLISRNIWTPYRLPKELRSNAVAAFLARHPTLKRVHIHSEGKVMVASELPRVSLPDLEYYEGDATFILVIDACGLKEVQLFWPDNTDTEKIITTVSSMAKPDFPFVSTHTNMGWTDSQAIQKILTSVSTHMRHTRALRLQTAKSHVGTFHKITECLPRFTSLVYLALPWITNFSSDLEQIAIECWGVACPTLKAFCLGQSAWRQCDNRWKEYPIDDFYALVGFTDVQFLDDFF
ncbi:hypothetical protein C8R45DRAFT_1207784 [Mycena sanguinolenta]|nr:hypothetical protein C8R45DRAFT_1207784 [Mycena sanguinolenta]